jgi:galactokinase
LNRHVAHAFAPGRVNLIGEHTDYNSGLALPFALGSGVHVEATLTEGPLTTVHALDLREDDRFDPTAPEPAVGWRAFARGVTAELAAVGVRVGPAAIEINGDVPRGAGLSSSAALCVALTLALSELEGQRLSGPIETAELCQRVENRWVGAQTGLLDHLASLCGEPGSASLIDFQAFTVERVPLRLDGHRLVVLAAGEPHSHAASGYNQRRRECAEAAARVGAESLRDAFIQDLHMLPDPLDRRARHVIGENGRVLEAVEALQRGDYPKLGELLDASHASLRDNFEVSTPAVEAAVAVLKSAGALGARLLGGGFGGSVLGLLPADTTLPQGAFEVSPAAGARLLPQTRLP